MGSAEGLEAKGNAGFSEKIFARIPAPQIYPGDPAMCGGRLKRNEMPI
jgi:hypothetical protein